MLPSSFVLQQLDTSASGWAYDLVVQTDDNDSMGRVASLPFNGQSLRTWKYPLHESNQLEVGTFIAQSHWETSRISEIVVHDCHDQRLGSFRTRGVKFPLYVIESPNGDQVARSERIHKKGSTVLIYDEHGHRLVTMSRPDASIFGLKRWTVDIADHNTTTLATDPRMLVMIMATIDHSTCSILISDEVIAGFCVAMILCCGIWCLCCCIQFYDNRQRQHYHYKQVAPTSRK